MTTRAKIVGCVLALGLWIPCVSHGAPQTPTPSADGQSLANKLQDARKTCEAEFSPVAPNAASSFDFIREYCNEVRNCADREQKNVLNTHSGHPPVDINSFQLLIERTNATLYLQCIRAKTQSNGGSGKK